MILYEHASSGNCLKCRLVLRRLELPYESVSVDLFRGENIGKMLVKVGPDESD